MKKVFTLAALAGMMLPAAAGEPIETEGSGFLTSAINNAIENAWAASNPEPAAVAAPGNAAPQYGRKLTGHASAPKFGGYYIGKYSYSDRDAAHGGDGFSQRLIRMYVDGTILTDFKYRIQIQANNASFHMKDVFIEWQRYEYFKVKFGQYKRAFGFENPMNPWDISTGDYSLMTKKLTGHSDYLGENTSNGGRDQGLQIQGDFLKMKDGRNLFHYQLGIWNGQGINTSDKDGKKDIIGTIQVQPVQDLWVGFFGWKGNWIDASGTSYDRNRYAFGAKYDHDGWTARAEYAHGQSNNGKGNADAWYVVGGWPVNDWFKLSAQYQTYRAGKHWSNAQCIYSLIPTFQLHKNLMFQVQYNWNNNRAAADSHYNELWAEVYFRF